jgi:uncharacterized protein
VIYNTSRNFTLSERKSRHFILFTLFLTVIFASLAWADKNLPAPQGLINDFAGIISPSIKEKMNIVAREVLDKTGATLTVVTFKDIEGIIPDGLAGQIREKAMVPYLKKGEYGSGLLNGLYATAGIIARDKGIKLTGLPPTQKKVSSKRGSSSYGIIPFVFLLFVFLFLFRSRRIGIGTFFLLMLLGGGRGGRIWRWIWRIWRWNERRRWRQRRLLT